MDTTPSHEHAHGHAHAHVHAPIIEHNHTNTTSKTKNVPTWKETVPSQQCALTFQGFHFAANVCLFVGPTKHHAVMQHLPGDHNLVGLI